MARSASPAVPSTQVDGSSDDSSYSSGSERSPSGWTHSTDLVGTASQLTGGTTRNGGTAQGQLARAQESLRRKDRQIAALKRQLTRLKQQLAPSAAVGGSDGGKIAVYRGAGALAAAAGREEATVALPQSTPHISRLTPAMKLTTLLLVTFLCWVFLV